MLNLGACVGRLCVVLGLLMTMAGCASRDPAVASPAPSPSVVGRVIAAADSRPLRDVPVFLVVTGGASKDRLVAKSATDSNGTFAFKDQVVWEPTSGSTNPGEEQRYYVFANSPEHGFSFATLLKGDRASDLTVRLVRPELTKVKVMDKDGKPMEGVLVYYAGGGITDKDAPDWDNAHRWSRLRGDVGISTGRTDTNGEVTLAGLHDGSVWRAEKPGHSASNGNSTITLLPATRLFGTVTYADGKPAAGAVVKVTYSGQSYWQEQTTTDDLGQYAIEDAPIPAAAKANEPFLAPGYAVKVTKAGSRSLVSATTRPTDKETRFDIQMQQAFIVSGKVVDDITGKPLAGIRFSALSLAEGQQSYDNTEMTTDSDGAFKAVVAPGRRFLMQWQDSPAGDYILDRQWMETQPNNFAHQAFSEEKVTADKTGIVIKTRLWNIGTLTGSAIDPAGKPVAGASVYLNSRVRPVRTNASGQFTLNCAPKDRDYELCVISKDKSLACITKLTKGTLTAELQLKPTVMREGIAKTPTGLPANGLKFYLDLKLNGDAIYQVREEPVTDAQGKFSIRAIPGAQYGIFWSADNETNRDYESSSSISINLAKLADSDPITFSARKYINSLMGTILDPQGKPVPNVKIAYDQGCELVTQDRRYNNTSLVVAADGTFNINRLADGEIPLKVSAVGFKTNTFNVATDEVDSKLVLRPRTEALIYRAKATGPDGKPVAGIAITLRRAEFDGKGKMTRTTDSVMTDAAGIARFASPTTAPTTRPVQFSQTVMLCDSPEYDLAVSPQSGADEDMDVSFALKKSTEHWQGKVLDDSGLPLKGAKVILTAMRVGTQHVNIDSQRESGTEPMQSCTYTTDGAGEFTLSRIGKESWVNVSITSPSLKRLHVYFDVNRDTASGAKQFAMQKGASLKGRIVIKATGEPLTFSPGIQNSYVSFLKGGNVVGAVQPGVDGTFSSDDLEPNQTYTVRFASMDDALGKWVTPTPVSASLKTGEVANVVIELEEGIPLAGHFTNAPAGQSFENASVRAKVSGGQQMYSAAARVKSDGTWKMWLPAPGTYELSSYLPSTDPANARPEQKGQAIVVEAGKPIPDHIIDMQSK